MGIVPSAFTTPAAISLRRGRFGRLTQGAASALNSGNKTRKRAMEPAYDLVIRGGELVDGTGAAARPADVAVKDGRIAAVGKVAGRGAEEIDAKDRVVAPGFVDIHTHYDGQATWESRM